MKKIIILDYSTASVRLLTINEDSIAEFGDLGTLVSELSPEILHDDCEWMVLDTDIFGNFEVENIVIHEGQS